MRFASKTIGLPIYRLFDKKIIAYVSDIIIDPKSGKLTAFQIKGNKIKKKNSLISPVDLFFYNREGIIIENDLKLSTKEDFPKGYKLLKENGKIKGRKVFKEKKYLGKVKDFTLDDTDTVSRLHIGKILSLKSLLEDTTFEFKNIKTIKNNKIYLN